MNSASQNFPHHLDVLRERMLHPTDYELAVNYSFEEFAGDVSFVQRPEPEQMSHLVAVLNVIVSKAIGRRVEVENALVSYLREHRRIWDSGRTISGQQNPTCSQRVMHMV